MERSWIKCVQMAIIVAGVRCGCGNTAFAASLDPDLAWFLIDQRSICDGYYSEYSFNQSSLGWSREAKSKHGISRAAALTTRYRKRPLLTTDTFRYRKSFLWCCRQVAVSQKSHEKTPSASLTLN